MNNLYNDITNYISTSGLNTPIVDNPCMLLKQIEKIFVRDNPRVWWTSLENKLVFNYSGDDAYKQIQKFLQECEVNYSNLETFYFIVDFDTDNLTNLIIEAKLEDIQAIIGNQCFFEYYITPKSFSWLLCENDHNQLIISYPISKRED